jgi:hypothetical protein
VIQPGEGQYTADIGDAKVAFSMDGLAEWHRSGFVVTSVS